MATHKVEKGKLRDGLKGLAASEPHDVSLPIRVPTFFAVKIVDSSSKQPVAGVVIAAVGEDGRRYRLETDGSGTARVEKVPKGPYTLHGELGKARAETTYQEAAGAADTSMVIPGPPPTDSARSIAKIEAYKVKTGDSLESVAKSFQIDFRRLAIFNWGTGRPSEINRHLRDRVGCTKKTNDGANYIFDDSDEPGVLLIPKPWTKEGLEAGEEHTIEVVSSAGTGKPPEDVWLLLRGDQSSDPQSEEIDTLQKLLSVAEEKVKQQAQSAGVELIEAELTDSGSLNSLLKTKRLRQVFHSGHGRSGGLVATNGSLIHATDIAFEQAYLQIVFRSVACQLGAAAKDWDLTFGEVYGGTHQSNLAGGIDFFTLDRVHADQQHYQDLIVEVGNVYVSAYRILKYSAPKEPAALVRSRSRSERDTIADLRRRIDARAAEAPSFADPQGGFSSGTDRQLHQDLDTCEQWLAEAEALAR